MEEKTNEQISKSKKAVSAIRIDLVTQKLVTSLLNKANRKSYGRKVKASQLIHAALLKLVDADLKDLQEMSLSNTDRMEMKYREYVKQHGSISKDEFLGLLLEQNEAKKSSENASLSEGKTAS